MPSFPEPVEVTVDDPRHGPITLALHELGEGPAVVLCHGFPELAYSWRHQLPALAAAGYRAIAPDMRGYGRSSRPDAIDAYGITQLTGDLVGILDALEIDKAVFVGHDWGGFVVWAMPLLHPERTAGVVGVCTPYMPFPSTELLLQLVGGDADRLYITWFQPDGVAERIMDPVAAEIFDALMRGGLSPEQAAAGLVGDDGLPNMNPFLRVASGDAPALHGDLVVDHDELSVYIDTYRRTGFRGGINWYRNIDANASVVPGVGTQPLDLPCLMLCAEWDPALPPAMADGMPGVIRDLERHDIPRAGHWVQQEAPEVLNEHLVDWLQRRFPS